MFNIRKLSTCSPSGKGSAGAWITLCILFLCWPSHGQENVPEFSHGVLWKIEKTGLKPSYLLGTMHVSDQAVLQFSEPLERVIKSADSLTLEVRFDETTHMAVFQSMLLSNGKTLRDYLSQQEMRIVQDSLKSQPMLAQASSLLKPWAVTLLLSLPKDDFGLKMDQVLQQRFSSEGKPVYQLETALEQLGLFEKLTEQEQVSLLRETIEHIGEIEDEIEQTLKSYLSEDIASLLELNNKHLKISNNSALPKLMYSMVEERNLKMMNRMLDRLQQGNALIAVGALHLPGEKGILKLLASAGYQVTNIPQK